MKQDDSDQRDDIINPLKPWRSMAVVFLLSWVAVLLDALDVPLRRFGGAPGLHPIALLAPFLVVLAYAALWTAWKAAQRRQQRRSRERRAMLGHDRLH